MRVLPYLFYLLFFSYSFSAFAAPTTSFTEFCDEIGINTEDLQYAAQHGSILEYGYGKFHQVGRIAGSFVRVTHTQGNGSDMQVYTGDNWSDTSLALTVNTTDTNPARVLLRNNSMFYLGGASSTGYPQRSNMVFREYNASLAKVYEHTFFDDGYSWDASLDIYQSSVLAAYRNNHSYYAALYDTASNSLGDLHLVLDDEVYGTIAQPNSCLVSSNEMAVAFYDNRYSGTGTFVLSFAIYNFQTRSTRYHEIGNSLRSPYLYDSSISSNQEITAAVWAYEGSDTPLELTISVFNESGDKISKFRGNVSQGDVRSNTPSPKIFVTKDSKILLAYGSNGGFDGRLKLVLYEANGNLLWQSNFYDSTSVFSNGMFLDGGRHGFDYDDVEDVLYYNYVSQHGASLTQRVVGLTVEGDEVRIHGSLGSPSIVAELVSQDVIVGDRVTFQADAIGEEILVDPGEIQPMPAYLAGTEVLDNIQSTLSYEWYKNDVLIVGESADRLILDSVTSGDGGRYYYKVTNHLGSITSNAATLTVEASVSVPSIVAHPTSQSVTSGSSVTLSVSASGESLSYQWYKGGLVIAGATSATHTIGSASETDAGSYAVEVSNSAGIVTSNAVTLTVESPLSVPVITSQPTGTSIDAALLPGSNYTLSVIASGSSLSYQWETYLPPAGWQDIQGATSSSYTATYNAMSDGGAFRVVVGNSAGSVTSDQVEVLVQDPAKSYLSTNTALTWSAAKAYAESQGGYLLEINSFGEWLYTLRSLDNSFFAMSDADYSNFLDSTLAPDGGGSAYLWLGGSDAAVEGEWRWASSGEQFWSGGVNGSAVNGAFNRWGKTTQQNEPDNYNGSQDALALALETWPLGSYGTGNELGYAYYWNDISAENQLYFIIEKDLGGPGVSAPSIDTHPTSRSVTSGSSVTLSVSASGEALSYQWYKGGSVIAGATSATYTIGSASEADSGAYTVEVSNSAGSVTSNAATLSVEASNPAPPLLAGKSFTLTPSTGELKSVPNQATFAADSFSYGFSGNLLASGVSYSYSNGTVTYDTEEVIKFTFTSDTGGTYEEGYNEGDGFFVENTGTFEEANINLSLQTNWQRSETMDSALSTQYWQIGATGGDTVAYNDGELNFIFESASVDSSNGYFDHQEIELTYAGALPLDEDWQIVIDDTYVSDLVSQFAMGYGIALEGSFDCEFGFGDYGAGREVYFYADSGSEDVSYFAAYQSSADDPRIQNGLNFRIQHLASTRELVYSYQPDGVSDWTELARINLSTGAATGLSGDGTLTGQLPDSSQNLFFAVDVDKYSTEPTPIENIEIGGIEIGSPPVLVESDGEASLLKGGGYYYIDSLSLPITYNGSPATDYAGYRYIGVEPDGSGGYELILLAEGTGVYNVWSVSSAGEAGALTSLSAGELALLESQWNQDINEDGDIGLTLNPIESVGSSSLLQDNVGGYYYIDSLSLPITYNGSPATDYAGYRYIGVEPDGSGGYELILLAEGTGVYNVWSVSSAGEAGAFTPLSAGELALLESQWNQDINEDGDLGGPGVAAPVITSQPTGIGIDAALLPGSDYSLSVSASGGSLSYQWETYLPPAGWQDIQGATSSSYTATYNAMSDGGAFRVVVGNSAGSVTSDQVEVLVQDPAKSYLSTNTALTWSAAKAYAESQGGYLLEINSFGEWLYTLRSLDNSFFAMSDADYSNFLDSTLAPDGGGSAYLWLGGSDAAVEGEWRWASSGEQFWSGGVNGSAVNGAFNRWGKTTQQNEPDNYNGSQDALALALETWPLGSYGTGNELGYAYYWNDISAENQLYFIIEKDLGGPGVSAPSIDTHPTSRSVTSGSSVTLSVSASGEALSYQWYKGGSVIAGATSATYTIGSASEADSGAYTVEVSNSAGSVTSNAATLSVEASNPAPPLLAGKSFTLTPSTGELKSVPNQATFAADSFSYGFSGNLLASGVSYSYSNGTVTYDTEEVIKFTFTSDTGGTYEEGYNEGDGFFVENTGTFEEANINLSLQTNWQRSETMDSALSTQYWQIGATGGDTVAYNDGELNFIFESASVDSSNGYFDHQEIELTYAGALPLDEDWQIVIDDTYVSDLVSQFAMGYGIALEGSFDCEFGFGDYGAGREVYFYADSGSEDVSYFAAYQSSADDPRIQNGLNFRIQHLASTRELVYSYQPDGVSDWTELARINLSTGAATGLSGDGTLTGQLPDSSQNLFFAVDVDKYSTEPTPIENIEIGGIEIGSPPVLVESDGEASLLKGGGYYYIDSLSLPITYNGSPATDYAGYRYIGVEPDGSGGYELILLAEGTGVYNVWSVSSAGEAGALTSLSAGELALLESQWNQDINEDGDIGLTLNPIESVGSSSLLQDNVGGYYYIDSLSLPITYNGSPATDYAGYRYIGVEPDGSGGYELILLAEGTGVYNVWSVSSAGEAGAFTPLSAGELALLESQWNQDINEDGDLGGPGVAAPVITSQPTGIGIDAALLPGSDYSLSVSASGGSLSYQWETYLPPAGWQDIQGATSSSYTATYNAMSDGGAFRVVVGNSAGSVTSDQVEVLVQDPAKSYLSTNTALTWSAAKAYAESQGGYLLEINSFGEWLYTLRSLDNSFFAMSDADYSNFLDSTLAPDGGGSAYLWLGGSDAAVEGEWRWASSGEQFWSGGVNGSAVNGAFNRWGKTTQQNEPDNYNGSQDALALALETWPLGSYGTGNELGYAYYWNDISAENQLYFIIEKDLGGPGVSAPSIDTHPTSRSVTSGSSVTLSVSASGEALSYQWYKGGSVIAGATSATYTIGSASEADAGSYTVVVSNSAGSVTSNAATLTVAQAVSAPSIDTHPATQSVTSGSSVTLSVSASGEAVSYQWYKGGAVIAGVTSATYTIGSASEADAGSYTVVVSNSAGSVTSNAATLTVEASLVLVESVGSSSLLQDNVGGYYYIDSLSLPITYNGSPVTDYQGYRYIGVEPDDSGGYELILLAEGTGVYNVWSVSSAGEAGSFTALSAGELALLESQWNQDINGDDDVGLTLNSIEIEGSSSLLQDNVGGYYYIDSLSLPITYNGSPVTDYQGYRYIGVEPDDSGGYELILLAEGTGVYNVWSVSSAGEAGSFTALSAGELALLESQWNQDINGDDDVGLTLNSIEIEGSSSLLQDNVGGYYYIDSLSLPITYNGSPVTDYQGYRYIGVEPDDSGGYELILLAEGTGVYNVWSVSSAGEAGSFTALSAGELALLESQWNQDINGDDDVGLTLNSIEIEGSSSLLQDNVGGYYYIDSLSLPITYNGSPVTDYQGYRYIGVEPDDSGGYELILLAEGTGVYNVWSVSSAGEAGSFTALSAGELALLESQWNQDINGDDDVGLTLNSIEIEGSSSLLQDNVGGYYYIDSLSLPITYNGSPVTDYQGYRYIGVEPDDSGGYELILLAEGTGVYNVWSVSSAGEAGSFTALSAGELALLESQWNQDINGDDDVGLTLNSIEIEGSSSLLQDNVGGYYYIDSLSLPITYNGSPVTDYQGYRYIGVEPDDSGGYELILLAEGTGVYNVWSVSSAGEAGSFTALSAGELALLESQWNQDINGDDDVGLTLNSIEIEGSSSLLQDNVGGYYYIDSLSLPITYNGSPVTDYQGYRYIGVEPDDSGGYELILLAEGTGVYNVWSVSSAGEAGSFTALSAGELALLESQWNQDINGDDDVGLTLNSIEIEGSSSLLQDNVGGYYYIDSLSLPITYNGSPVTDYQGYRYIGVEPDDSGGYELILLAEGTGVYNVWSVSSAGEAGSFTALSAGEVIAKEESWNQDINGDSFVGPNPNSYAIYTLEPGTIINGVDHTSFIGSSNDMVSFYKDPYDGVDIAPVSYVRTGANTATFVEGAGTEYYYGGISTYPAQSTTVTFTSPNSVTRDYDGNVYTLTFPEDLAPTSLAGLNVATNSTGYSNIYGGYSGSAALNFSTSSNGTYYGTNTLPINYTYQKIGPREGRLNATGNVPNYGTVNASYIFHFLTAATGYFVGQETYTSSGLVETSWGTFEIY